MMSIDLWYIGKFRKDCSSQIPLLLLQSKAQRAKYADDGSLKHSFICRLVREQTWTNQVKVTLLINNNSYKIKTKCECTNILDKYTADRSLLRYETSYCRNHKNSLVNLLRCIMILETGIVAFLFYQLYLRIMIDNQHWLFSPPHQF